MVLFDPRSRRFDHAWCVRQEGNAAATSASTACTCTDGIDGRES
jgi:hypothetical protein